MSVARYFILIAIGTVVCWVAWILVLININPFSAGIIGMISFYLSMLLALIGTFFLAGFGFRTLIHRSKRDPFQHVGISARQSILLAVLLVGALILQGERVFSWWAAAFLLAALIFLEFFFLIQNEPHEPQNRTQ